MKLAYVPDSPTEEKAGDDPFDTSIVEKTVGPLPVIKKKRQLVSIGAAAEILTVVNEQKRNQPPPRRTVQPPAEIQLLCCFDDEPGQDGSQAATPFDQPTPQTDAKSPAPPAEAGLKDILAEFDVIPETVDAVDAEDFIVKPAPAAPATPVAPVAAKPELVDEEDFEFEALAYESLAKNPQPALPEPEEDDPFDTSSVEKVLGKDATPAVSSVAPATAAPPRPAPPSRPPRPRAPPPTVSLAAAAAVLIDPKPAGTSAPEPVPALPAQDSFEALFLSDEPAPVAPSAQETPVVKDTKEETREETREEPNFEIEDVDPFDTSVADRLVAGLTLESDPALEELEDDPFDTSAVERVLH